MLPDSRRAGARLFLWAKGLLLAIYLFYCLYMIRTFKLEIANLSGLVELYPFYGSLGVMLTILCLRVFCHPFANHRLLDLGCLCLLGVLLFPFWINGTFYGLHLLAAMGGSVILLVSLFWRLLGSLWDDSRQKERQALFGLVLSGGLSIGIWAFEYQVSGDMELFFTLSLCACFYALEVLGSG